MNTCYNSYSNNQTEPPMLNAAKAAYDSNSKAKQVDGINLSCSNFRCVTINTQRGSRHKCNRLLKKNGSQSRLIGKLSSFLSSRNVIRENSEPFSQVYDKIVDEDLNESEHPNLNNKSLRQQASFYQHNNNNNNRNIHTNYNEQQYQNQLFGPFSSNHHVGNYKKFHKSSETRRRLQLLASAILRGHKSGLNKTSLFLSLLRAPIVLAALFSLMLIVSLMTLYTMSFHHFHLCQQQKHLQQQQQQSSEANNNETSSDNYNNKHIIFSRHLIETAGSRVNSLKNRETWRDKLTTSLFDERTSKEAFNRAFSVETECGAFVGVLETNSIAFRGIPYASPPIGKRRWTRPRPIWEDDQLCEPKRISEMRRYRDQCAQQSPMTRRFTGHEDCLYLNVYVPRLASSQNSFEKQDTKKLPVMVYIHGGFLSYGSAGSVATKQDWSTSRKVGKMNDLEEREGNKVEEEGGERGDGEEDGSVDDLVDEQVDWMRAAPSGQLASELGIVLVSFNYRLQALGFLTLSQLAKNNGPFGSEGNYGLWDQLTALNWIKRNIESFGGDPNNIVLFGGDSASSLPLALLSSLNEEESESFSSGCEFEESSKEDCFAFSEKNNNDSLQSKSFSNLRDEQTLDWSHKSTRQDSGGVEKALDANQIDSKASQREKVEEDEKRRRTRCLSNASNKSDASETKLDTHDLFRAAWLTNPAVYYELPYELANQHYQRLFLNQSPCKDTATSKSASLPLVGQQNLFRSAQTEATFESLKGNAKATEPAHYSSKEETTSDRRKERYDNETMIQTPLAPTTTTTTTATTTTTKLKQTQTSESQRAKVGQVESDKPTSANPTLECLMRLTSEEVVRYYLAKDEPSYRLDDQNSLPIHGIFADQFVTVDQELVRHSYPFGSRKKLFRLEEDQPPTTDEIKSPSAISNDKKGSEKVPNNKEKKKKDGKSSSSSSRLASQATNGRYKDSQGVAISDSDNYLAHNCAKRKRRAQTSFLLGSTAQAVEFWPCPRNLNQWNWQDFKRYVATSLNSFSSNTYNAAAILYNVPSNLSSSFQVNSSNAKSPKETYLTMVSDIRQLCPINELASQIKQQAAKPNVFRYIVEHKPSKPFPVRSVPNASVEFAFHNWDLIAFLGFQFEPRFEPSEQDFKFQAEIRRMVKEFVFNIQMSTITTDSSKTDFAVLGSDGSKRLVSSYKNAECAMWRRHLGRNYAWVS